NTRTPRLILRVEQYGSVVFETDVRSILPSYFLPGPDDHRLGNRSLLYLARGHGRLDRDNNLVSYRSISLAGSAQNVHAKNLLCTAVIGYGKSGFTTYHGAL